LRELCRQQGVELFEGYAMKNHIHAVVDSAKIQCGQYQSFSVGEISDTDIQELYAGKVEFHWASFLARG